MGAVIHTAARFVATFEEDFEQVFAVLRRNADSSVPNLNLDPTVVLVIGHWEVVYANVNLLAALAKLNRILDEIDQNVLTAHFINDDPFVLFIRTALEDNADAHGLSLDREHINNLLNNQVQRVLLQIDSELVAVKHSFVELTLHLLQQHV